MKYLWQQYKETLTDFNKWTLIRQYRNELLARSDWMVTRCYEQGVEVPKELLEYREKLRNIPQDYEKPDLVVEPVLDETVSFEAIKT